MAELGLTPCPYDGGTAEQYIISFLKKYFKLIKPIADFQFQNIVYFYQKIDFIITNFIYLFICLF